MLRQAKSFFSTWMHQKIPTIKPDRTLAILVDKSEVADLDYLKPFAES